MRRPSLNWLLVLVPISLIARFALDQDLLVFLTAAGAVIGLFMPALFVLTTGRHDFVEREVVSGTVAGVLMVLYGAALLFTMVTHEHLFHTPTEGERAGWPVRTALLLLVGATVVVAVESELLVGA